MKNAVVLLALCAFTRLALAQDEFEKEIDKATEEAESQKKKEPMTVGSNMPKVQVAADLTGSYNPDEVATQEVASNSGNVREVELGFSSAIDHWALGTVNFAAHQEDGEFAAELHEAFFELNTLPFGLYGRAGKFFVDAGRRNSIHRHDWQFTQAPIIHEELFGDEGINPFGGELSILMPWPFYQELKVGAFGTNQLRHEDTISDKPNPLFSGRLKHFIPFTTALGSQVGLSYLRYNRVRDNHNVNHYLGFDHTLKWARGKRKSFEWTTELWHKQRLHASSPTDMIYGAYSFIQYQPWAMWKFGIRFDFFRENDEDRYSDTWWITLAPSEFSSYRLSAEFPTDEARQKSAIVLFQATFILGHHPAHRY